MEKLLKPVEVAGMLGITVGTLANWRSQKRGPPFLKAHGVLLYPETAFARWIVDNTVEMDRLDPKPKSPSMPGSKQRIKSVNGHRFGGHRTQSKIRKERELLAKTCDKEEPEK